MKIRWIITAAHCLWRRDEIAVYLGIGQNGTFGKRIYLLQANLHIHPDYNHAKNTNDIGKYKLQRKSI